MIQDFIKSLEYASVLQRGAMPRKRHFDKLFDDHFILNMPTQVVSGDFFWVADRIDHQYVIVGDCTGHGVPGAMLTMLMLNITTYAINKKPSNVSEMLREIDKKFLETFEYTDPLWDHGNDWVDLAICKVIPGKRTVEFGGAHKKIVVIQDGQLKLFRGNKYPIGGWQIEENRTYETTTFNYEKGAKLYLGSDGYQDQLSSGTGKKFGSSKLNRLLKSIHELPMDQQKEYLINFHRQWRGINEQTDDICLIGVQL